MGEADRGETVGIVGEAKGDGVEAEEGDNFSAFAGDGTIDEAKLFVMTEPVGDHGAGEVASDEEVEGGTDIGAEGDGEEAISEAEEATGGDAEGREWDADELEDDEDDRKVTVKHSNVVKFSSSLPCNSRQGNVVYTIIDSSDEDEED